MQATAPSLNAPPSDIAALVGRWERTVVGIHAEARMTSGFFWKPDVIVTASEALEAGKGETIKLSFSDGEVADARVLGHDPATDVALIAAERSGEPVSASPQAGRLGDGVLALGRSAYGATCAAGSIALAGAAWQSLAGGEIARRLWLDLRLPRHAEGGPVLVASGSFLGMAVFGPRRRTIVIPAETIERVGAEIRMHGRVRKGYLGVSLHAVRVAGSSDQSGLMVVSLDENGPARNAGILQGDILIRVGGNAVQSVRSLARLLPGAQIGSAARIDLVRAGESKSLDVMIGESPRA